MFKDHDFQYAMESTRVVVTPHSAIETFGTTRFHFNLVSELLDEVDTVRIRTGTIEAERPRILTRGRVETTRRPSATFRCTRLG